MYAGHCKTFCYFREWSFLSDLNNQPPKEWITHLRESRCENFSEEVCPGTPMAISSQYSWEKRRWPSNLGACKSLTNLAKVKAEIWKNIPQQSVWSHASRQRVAFLVSVPPVSHCHFCPCPLHQTGIQTRVFVSRRWYRNVHPESSVTLININNNNNDNNTSPLFKEKETCGYSSDG